MDTAKQTEDKQRLASGFNLASTGYDKPALCFLALTAKRLVELAPIYSGQKILDVATGTGTVAMAAAQIVAPDGQVFGVDIATEMLAQAQLKITEAGLSNVHLQQGDAMHLNFSDNTFDAVLCASGLHLFLSSSHYLLSQQINEASNPTSQKLSGISRLTFHGKSSNQETTWLFPQPNCQ